MSNVKKPDPVAWRYWRESRKWFVYLFKEPKVLQRRHQCLITTDQSEAYADERVREALENAAKELERRRNLLINQNVVLDIKEGVAMYDLCAGAIRALIPKE